MLYFKPIIFQTIRCSWNLEPSGFVLLQAGCKTPVGDALLRQELSPAGECFIQKGSASGFWGNSLRRCVQHRLGTRTENKTNMSLLWSVETMVIVLELIVSFCSNLGAKAGLLGKSTKSLALWMGERLHSKEVS